MKLLLSWLQGLADSRLHYGEPLWDVIERHEGSYLSVLNADLDRERGV